MATGEWIPFGEGRYRAERVVETIRLQRYRINTGATPDGCCPVGAAANKTISASDVGCMPFWGPLGANVVEAGARYQLSYNITNNSVTVEAQPLTSGPNVYLGPATTKAVIYVAQLQ